MKQLLTTLSPTGITYKVLGLFALFFWVLFLQFPLAGSLPGYTDTWLYVGLFNDYGNHIQSWFTGQPLGHCLYPSAPPYAYLEPSYASAVFFLFFKLIRFDDLWAYYGFIVTIFTLNATAAFVLAKQYIGQNAPAMFAALVFAASSFALGNMENQNALVYFPALICIYHFRAFLLRPYMPHLVVAMVAGGLQIYFGTYTFIFQSVVLFLLGLVHYRAMFFANGWVAVLKTIPIYILLALPYMVAYLMNPELGEFYNPSRNDLSALNAFSLHLTDFYRVLPNNLLYPIQQDLPQIFVYNLRSASLGIMLYVLVLVGFFSKPPFRFEAVLIGIVSLIVALGPMLLFDGQAITMPMGWLYELLDISAFIRHPSRMFFITILMLSLLAGYGLKNLAARFGLPIYGLVAIASLVFIIENVPFPFEKYSSRQYIVDSNPYPYIVPHQGKNTVVLELPSSLDFESNDLGKPLNQFSREYLYMYWQSKHRQHSLNGAVAFFSPQRLRNATLTASLPNTNALHTLIETNGINYIIYHPRLLLAYEKPYLDFLMASPTLVLVEANQYVHIFKVVHP
jgi:hypothetical protein